MIVDSILQVLSFAIWQSFEGLALYWYALLFVAAVFGGLVGSLSGGAGMITMPLLLLSGINPLQALATNKLQACIGSLTGAVHYYKQGLVSNHKDFYLTMGIAVVFSSVGAISVHFIALEILAKVLPFVMIAVGLYFLFLKRLDDVDKVEKPRKILLYFACAVTSIYGGFLGVGIGTFILMILTSLAGYGLSRALAYSRWIVFGINLSAIAFFILGGNVLWGLGFCMCVGQVLGASLGAKLAIKYGARLIRPFVISLCFLLSLQLILKEFF